MVALHSPVRQIKHDLQVCYGDQPMLSLIVLFWQKPYVCVQQVWDPVRQGHGASPPLLGVMHPSFA